MHNTNAFKDLTIAGFAFVTSITTAIIILIVERLFNFSIYTMMWFFVPIGAFMAGVTAASGYYFGAKKLNIKPNTNMIWSMILASIFTFFFIHYVSYSTLTHEGIPVSDYVSFVDYLDIRLTNATLYQPTLHKSSTGELGSFGYVMGFIQIVGFSAGGFATYIFLKEQDYCNKCKKYFKEIGRRSKYFTDQESLSKFYLSVIPLLKRYRIKEVYKMHDTDNKKGGMLSSYISIFGCPVCGLNTVHYGLYYYNGDWKEIKDKQIKFYTYNQL